MLKDNDLIKQIFLKTVHQYASDNSLTAKLWFEIEQAYSGKNRHYHTLKHLENLLNQLMECKDDIEDWHVIVLSICYHDIIYDVLKHDNEEKSALLAAERLTAIGLPVNKIEKCKVQILATKTHENNVEPDTNLFTDADLSILGRDWDVYEYYCMQVRREYSVYPDVIYKPGRKKVLQHFLKMERIFKTTYFFNRFEEQARLNLTHEMDELDN